jgi:N-acetylneuraminic acid mutarotase
MWEVRTQLPESFSEIATAELDGKIYVIGGYPGTRVYVDTVQVYDSATDSWSYTTPVPQPLHHTVAASAGGRLYVIGGEISATGLANQGIFINNLYEYDPSTATWTEKAPMPTARSGGTAGVIDGKIYVAGGRPPGGADFAVYDPATDQWTVLPNLPTQRNHLASGVIGGNLYVVGGRFGGGVGSEMTDIVEIYDPATNTWTRGTPLLEPRAGLNGITVRGCLYTFGGEGNDSNPLGIFPNVEVYNPLTDAWIPLEPIPVPVHGVTGAAYINGYIHLAGGGISRGGNSGATIHQVFPAALTCE